MHTRLAIRRDVVLDLTRLKDEFARCPSEKVERTAAGRAALVLEAEGTGDGLRVVASALQASVDVNNRFVACATSVLQGRTLASTAARAGSRLRISIPIGQSGNSLSVSSASLTQVDEE